MNSNEPLLTQQQHPFHPNDVRARRHPLNKRQVYQKAEKFFQEILSLLKRKNEDYAGENPDGLRNFRETARRLNLTMPQVFLVLMEKHFQALENDSQSPDLLLHEGVADRLRDMACYSCLFFIALSEGSDARAP